MNVFLAAGLLFMNPRVAAAVCRSPPANTNQPMCNAGARLSRQIPLSPLSWRKAATTSRRWKTSGAPRGTRTRWRLSTRTD